MSETKRQRRADQIALGDFIPFWGEDLEVVVVRPEPNDFHIRVVVRRGGQERIIMYDPGTIVEVVNAADKLRGGDDAGATPD